MGAKQLPDLSVYIIENKHNLTLLTSYRCDLNLLILGLYGIWYYLDLPLGHWWSLGSSLIRPTEFWYKNILIRNGYNEPLA